MLHLKQFKICKTTGIHINKYQSNNINNNLCINVQNNDDDKYSSSKKLSISDASSVSANNKTEEGSIRFSLVRESSNQKSNYGKKVQCKNLDNVKVQYKKIQDFEEQKRKRKEAKQFVDRMKKDKIQFEGKLLLLKQRKQRKKQLQLLKQKTIQQQQQNQKIKRRQQAQQRVQIILSRILQRKKISKNINYNQSKIPYQHQNSHDFSCDGKFKQDKKFGEDKKEIKKSESIPVNKFKKRKRLKEIKNIKHRAKSKSTGSMYLDTQQKRQIKLIRQKISLLTRKLRQC